MGTVGTAYTYTATATDADDGDTLSFALVTQLVDLAPDAAFNTDTGVLAFTPDAAGDYPVEITVTDGVIADPVSQTFTIVVTEASNVVLTVFETAEVPEWAFFTDASAGAEVIMDDAPYGEVVQFTISSENPNTVAGFTAALSSSNEGLAPVTGVWQTYTFDLADLASAGIDLSAIDIMLIFPAYGQGAGAVYLVDNFVVATGAAAVDPEPTPSEVVLTVFETAEVPEWAFFTDASAGAEVIMDDAPYGEVVQFTISSENPNTVAGFTARTAGTPFDASAYASTGTLSFDMKVVTNTPAADTPWYLKLEAVGGANTGDYALSSSNEGLAPVTGVWQTYTFDLADLASAGIDLSAIDIMLIFPAYGQGAGAVYLVDNFVVETGAAAVDPEPTPSEVVLTVFETAEVPEWFGRG
jgi:hypothetical protein